MPQIVAHRGYKAKFPENTLLAFKNAITFGAHGLETDVHLTKDNVVVLSHVWEQHKMPSGWVGTANVFSDRILLSNVALVRMSWLQIVNGTISRT